MLASTLRVAVVQFEHAPGDKPANFNRIEDFVEKAAPQGVKLIVFPELSITGHKFLTKRTKMELLALAEPVPTGPSTARLRSIAKRYQVTIGAGLVERDEIGKMFNTYLVVSPNGVINKHRKLQPFDHEAIASGDSYSVFDLPLGVRVGLLIGDDACIAENARITALMGAQVLLSPQQTGGCNANGMKAIDPDLWDDRDEKGELLQAELVGTKGKASLMRWLPSRAFDNGMFLLVANGIGMDCGEVRTGNSMILDPLGRTLAETDVPDDAMVVAELDLSLIGQSPAKKWMQARRPELYAPLTMPVSKDESPVKPTRPSLVDMRSRSMPAIQRPKP